MATSTHERDAWKRRYDEACAVLKLPDSTNDGGPGDLAEAIRELLHNQNVLADDAIKATRERDEALLVLSDACMTCGGPEPHTLEACSQFLRTTINALRVARAVPLDRNREQA